MLILIAGNLGWWWYYQSMSSYFEEQLSRRLSGNASTASLYFSGTDIDRLLIEDFEIYARILTYLDSLAQIDSLLEVSIIDRDFNYLISTRDDILADESYLLSQLNFAFLQTALTGKTTASELYNVDGTYLKSAYAPLYDSANNISAILVVEAGATYFDLLSELRYNLFLLAGGSGGVVIILLAFFIFYHRRLAIAEEKVFMAGSQAALGRMVSVVSHEIKNPLMILGAAGERLEKKYSDEEASFITEEVSRLDEIVTGYLSFARGQRKTLTEKINIVELTRKITADLRGQFDEKNIELVCSSEEGLPDIEADKIGIRQVILNLLLNALQAAEHTREGYKKTVSIKIYRSDASLVIRVRDSGPGIKKKHREKLFEPFYTTKTKGSGLGLYLCRRIIHDHQGTINIVDDPEFPMNFEVKLPWRTK
ncbi:MAG: HAMP domain-containing sensor histidine kinase [candidate division Zixibacteria bacterium]